jgi:uncharacterized protein DUF5336
MTADLNQTSYAGYGVPDGNYSWYAPAAENPTDAPSRIGRSLWGIVAILGAATFGVSVGSSLGTGFLVRLAVLAAVIAAVGLLPRQPGRGWIVVAFAVTGLLDALGTWVSATNSDWVLPVIVVLNALQSLAAVGALLSETGAIRSSSAGAQNYSAYASFVAAYQDYVAQYQQSPTQYYTSGQASADAQADGELSVDPAAEAAQKSEALRARYAQYDPFSAGGGGAGGSVDGSTSDAARDPGVPGAIRGAAPRNQPQRTQRGRSGGRPSTEPGR